MAISAKCGGDRLGDFRLDLVGGRRRPGSTVSGAKGRGGGLRIFFQDKVGQGSPPPLKSDGSY